LTYDIITPYYPIFKPRVISEESRNLKDKEKYIYDLSRDKFKISSKKDDYATVAKKIARGKLSNLNKSFDCVKEKLPYFSKNEIQLATENLNYNQNWFPSLKFSSNRTIKQNDYTILPDGSKVVKEIVCDNAIESSHEI